MVSLISLDILHGVNAYLFKRIHPHSRRIAVVYPQVLFCLHGWVHKVFFQKGWLLLIEIMILSVKLFLIIDKKTFDFRYKGFLKMHVVHGTVRVGSLFSGMQWSGGKCAVMLRNIC
jgi:hypothetical protein